MRKGSLAGRNALITGASQGLGFAIARAYVEAGASVMLCARDTTTLEASCSELKKLTGERQQVLVHRADVSSPKDVEALAAHTFQAFSRLHVLVNNAGVYGPIGSADEVNWNEWVKAIEINLFGSVLMCRAVLEHFTRCKYGKIVQLSGGGATSPLPRFSAYAASKAGIVRFVETLAEETRAAHIDVNAVAPGALNTRLLQEVLRAGPQRAGDAFYERSLKQQESGGTPMEKGAALCVFLGSAASDGITGKLISAVWDPWEDLPDRLEEIGTTDIYTLRRIVPKDRGQKWGE